MNNRIKDFRSELGLTQDELAEKVGVSRQTIISLEKGKYSASIGLAYKLSKVFNKTIEDLFIFEEHSCKE